MDKFSEFKRHKTGYRLESLAGVVTTGISDIA